MEDKGSFRASRSIPTECEEGAEASAQRAADRAMFLRQRADQIARHYDMDGNTRDLFADTLADLAADVAAILQGKA